MDVIAKLAIIVTLILLHFNTVQSIVIEKNDGFFTNENIKVPNVIYFLSSDFSKTTINMYFCYVWGDFEPINIFSL